MHTCMIGTIGKLPLDVSEMTMNAAQTNTIQTNNTNVSACIPKNDGGAKSFTFKNSSNIITLTIPKIKEILVYNDMKVDHKETYGLPHTVRVVFDDGTEQRASANHGDTFDIERGIETCLMKRIFDPMTLGNGSRMFNKIVEYGMKFYEQQEKEKAEAIKRQIAYEEKKKKLKEKKMRRAARRYEAALAEEQKEAQDFVNMMKEAFVLAMHEIEESKGPAEDVEIEPNND